MLRIKCGSRRLTNDEIEFNLLSRVVESWSGCWELQSYVGKSGYPHASLNGKYHNASRVSYIIFVGPISENEFVLHKCDNRKCINPNHLFLGTHRDNVLDCMKKGRTPRALGEKNHFAKLSDDTVRAIRDSAGNELTQQALADIYGVTQSCISKIQLGKTWKTQHMPEEHGSSMRRGLT